MSTLTLYDLRPSPNNVKVRLALGYKGIPYEIVEVDPADRTPVVEASGQPLTPTIRHGDVVMFDSSAILRYLEANVAREPRLFAEDRETMHAIEAWEHRTRGGDFGAPVGMIFEQYFAAERDPAVIAEANRRIEARAREVEEALGGGEYLVAGRLTAADLCVVPLLWTACLTDEEAQAMSAWGVPPFFREHFRLDPAHEAVHAYVRRVMAHDRPL